MEDALDPEVVLLYESHRKYGTRPTLAQLTEVLQKLVPKQQRLHAFVDALDECADSEPEALEFVTAVQALGPQLKILCTSRFSFTFEDYFRKYSKLAISAKHEDLQVFVDAQIQKQYRLSKLLRNDAELKDRIINTITTESQGM